MIFAILLTLATLIYFLISISRTNASLSQKVEHLEDALHAAKAPTIDLSAYVGKDLHFHVKSQLEAKERELQVLIAALTAQLAETAENLEKTISAKKSSEVRLGHISEQLVPFLENFPHNPKNLRALFQPIDYICFNEDGIVFIEVKSGDAALSTKQRHIRDLIDQKKVSFEVFRIKGE